MICRQNGDVSGCIGRQSEQVDKGKSRNISTWLAGPPKISKLRYLVERF